MSEEQASIPEWAQALPDEIKSDPYFQKAERTPEQFAADFVNARKLQGNMDDNYVRRPGPDASDEDRAAFRQKIIESDNSLMPTPNLEDDDAVNAVFSRLGRPDNADAYIVSEELGLEGESLGNLKSLAFKAGMTQKQFDAYAGQVSSGTKAEQEAMIAKHAEQMATLKGDWGAAYSENVGQIAALLKTNATTPKYLIEQLEAGTLPADQVRWLHSLAETVSNEDGQFHQQGDTPQTGGMLSPAEANLRAEEAIARLTDRASPPSKAEADALNKRIDAYLHMANGDVPPVELQAYIQ